MDSKPKIVFHLTKNPLHSTKNQTPTFYLQNKEKLFALENYQ